METITNPEELNCKQCGNPFERRTSKRTMSRQKSAIGNGSIRSMNSVTCSPRCSSLYDNRTEKSMRQQIQIKIDKRKALRESDK